jgi:hypothetical protein
MNTLLWCVAAILFASIAVVIATNHLILRRLREEHEALFRELKSPDVDDFGLGFVSDAYRAYRRFVKSDRHKELRDARLSMYVVIGRRAEWVAYAAIAFFGVMWVLGVKA